MSAKRNVMKEQQVISKGKIFLVRDKSIIGCELESIIQDLGLDLIICNSK